MKSSAPRESQTDHVDVASDPDNYGLTEPRLVSSASASIYTTPSTLLQPVDETGAEEVLESGEDTIIELHPSTEPQWRDDHPLVPPFVAAVSVDETAPSEPLPTQTIKKAHISHSSREQKPEKGERRTVATNPEVRRKTPIAMEDFTQKSSLSVLSPTQQNSESAYEQFKLPIAEPVLGDYSSLDVEVNPVVEELHDSVGKHQSAFTESTAHTYGEDETGHVQFDTIVPDGSIDFEENLSQDASFAPREEYHYGQSYASQLEPQTPAPPLNPFANKGSVMKEHEMFDATQPSSIGRHLTSAISASSRPSPNVYDDFTSPIKRNASSPLASRVDGDRTSPLQSSVRDLLRTRSIDSLTPNHAPLFRAPGVQSFDTGPRIQPQNQAREPRSYVSMQESQELRRRETESFSPGSGSDTEFSDMDDVPRRRFLKRKREQAIKKELTGVGVRKRTTPGAKFATSSSEIVIPSTGRKCRRRSTQEDYIAQCEGNDARDTQQDDVIADSQADDPGDQAKGTPVGCSVSSTESAITHRSNPHILDTSPPLPDLVSQSMVDAEANTHCEDTFNQSNDIDLPQLEPDLPLQEVSTNRNGLRTPMAIKSQPYSDAANSTVPETSPAEESRLQPMGEIATISFGETQSEPLDVPEFSQDLRFEEAIRFRSSPEPTPQRRRAPQIPHFPITAEKALDTPLPASPKEAVEELNPQTDGPDLSADIPPAPDISENHNDLQQEDFEKPNQDGTRSEAQIQGLAKIVEPELPEIAPVRPKRGGLRTKEQLKGPSKDLRRTETKPPLKTYSTPRQSARVTKSSSTANTSSSKRAVDHSIMSTPLSSLPTLPSSSAKSTPSRSSGGQLLSKSVSSSEQTPVPLANALKPYSTRVRNSSLPTPVSIPTRKSTKRRSMAGEDPVPTRSSKRQAIPKPTRDSSIDPLAGPSPFANTEQPRGPVALFADMAFAVSYVKQTSEKDSVLRLIRNGGGQILDEGFDSLFDLRASEQDSDLALSPAATRITFTALIADEHSRKAKYMQALALNLPCISGRWISACVSKGHVINWTPYLLCAGQSSVLGNAVRSRTLTPYPATEAKFMETFENRERLLSGNSILLVTGKGRGAEEKRKAYVFLARALGPDRFEQVPDLEQARKKLLSADSEVGEDGKGKFDLLYVDTNEIAAGNIVFGTTPSSTASKKRKRGPVIVNDVSAQPPKKIRIISDEVVIQSLILGELLDSSLP